MVLQPLRMASARCRLLSQRSISTLPTNRHIKAFPSRGSNGFHILTYLDTDPPSLNLAIGTTTQLPPTPRSFTQNPKFIPILHSVLCAHVAGDPDLANQAKAFASPASIIFGSESMRQGQKRGSGADRGNVGGAGLGGFVHLSDSRNPPDFARIAWPEDIFGSIQVDGDGNIVGDFMPNNTYRVVTNEGILGLSDFLAAKLIEKLKSMERNA